MVVTFDTKPTTFGDRLIVTGTYAVDDTTIDATEFFSEIHACFSMPTAATDIDTRLLRNLNFADLFTINLSTNVITITEGTSINGVLAAGADNAGKFMIIGRRG
tara:strand:+ start:1119 stop:1430 length:312 start_codon:yes stop_codon:yes gene_type:complete